MSYWLPVTPAMCFKISTGKCRMSATEYRNLTLFFFKEFIEEKPNGFANWNGCEWSYLYHSIRVPWKLLTKVYLSIISFEEVHVHPQNIKSLSIIVLQVFIIAFVGYLTDWWWTSFFFLFLLDVYRSGISNLHYIKFGLVWKRFRLNLQKKTRDQKA